MEALHARHIRWSKQWSAIEREPAECQYQLNLLRLEAEAVAVFRKRLSKPGVDGTVWIHYWGRRNRGLGTVKEFLETRPELFTIEPGDGCAQGAALGGASQSALAPRPCVLREQHTVL